VSRITIVMDVDKKLGMSLDDLIKKTRPSKQNKGGQIRKGKMDRKGKLGVKKSLGKKKGDDKAKTRSVGKATAGSKVRRQGGRIRRVSAAGSGRNDTRVERRKSETGGKFSRKVVVKKGPNAPSDERRKVKITNVPYDLTWKDVKSALSEVGSIERCDVEHGVALITFAGHKEAVRAIKTYDNGDMNGRKIRVSFV
jgi:RNA recognition motif-containing protein